jgi:hypothetical protein
MEMVDTSPQERTKFIERCGGRGRWEERWGEEERWGRKRKYK